MDIWLRKKVYFLRRVLLLLLIGSFVLPQAVYARDLLNPKDDWDTARRSLYAASARYLSKPLLTSGNTQDPDKKRIFAWYTAPTNTREEALRCFRNGFFGEEESGEYVIMNQQFDLLTIELRRIVSGKITDGMMVWKDPFPLEGKVEGRLIELGLSPETAHCRYIWVPNYEYGAYAFYSPDRKIGAFLIATKGTLNMPEQDIWHTSLQVGEVYSLQQVRNDLLENLDGAFYLEKWQVLIDDYYKEAEQFKNERILWDNPISKYDGNIVKLDRDHITPYYQLNINTRKEAEMFFQTYKHGKLFSFVKQIGYAIPFWSDGYFYRESNGRQGDGLLVPENGYPLKLEKVFAYRGIDFSVRSIVFGPAMEPVLKDIQRMGFSPENTKAASLNIPYFSDGVLFYDDEKEVFIPTCSAYDPFSLFTKKQIYPMEELVGELQENKRYLIPDENGYRDTVLDEFGNPRLPNTAKPVIYLYPPEKRNLSLRLDFRGKLASTIPEYAGGWDITAFSDGHLIDNRTGEEYPYLF